MKPGEGTKRGDTDGRGNLGERHSAPLSNQGLRGGATNVAQSNICCTPFRDREYPVEGMRNAVGGGLKSTVRPLCLTASLRWRRARSAQTIVQCLSRNAQQLGGNPLVSVGTLECFFNQQLFGIFQGGQLIQSR